MSWYFAVLKKYAQFSGRARRTEYWMFFVVSLIISAFLAFIDGRAGTGGIIGIVYSLAVLVPSLAVTVRRLHDTDRSGWWLLIFLVPVIGAIVLLVFAIVDGTPGDNRFGPSPKATAVQATTLAA
jgi:uncharacterized membrane protein YhaH (DUF805 family)